MKRNNERGIVSDPDRSGTAEHHAPPMLYVVPSVKEEPIEPRLNISLREFVPCEQTSGIVSDSYVEDLRLSGARLEYLTPSEEVAPKVVVALPVLSKRWIGSPPEWFTRSGRIVWWLKRLALTAFTLVKMHRTQS